MSIQITATGRATKDPEVKFFPSGQSVTNFKIAVNHRKKNQSGEWVDDSTSFINVEVWGKRGEAIAEQVKKGHMLTVTGQMKVRQYEHQGEKRTSVDVNATEVAKTVMPARQGQPQQQNSTAQTHEFGQDDPWSQDVGSDPAPF